MAGELIGRAKPPRGSGPIRHAQAHRALSGSRRSAAGLASRGVCQPRRRSRSLRSPSLDPRRRFVAVLQPAAALGSHKWGGEHWTYKHGNMDMDMDMALVRPGARRRCGGSIQRASASRAGFVPLHGCYCMRRVEGRGRRFGCTRWSGHRTRATCAGTTRCRHI